MKLKKNLNNKNAILNALSLSGEKNEGKNITINNISNNFKNNVSLLLKKEIGKTNSTTQTAQKSMINSKEENSNYCNYCNSHKTIYNTFFNNEKRKNIFKKNSKLFLLNDKLYTRNEFNGKFFFLQENFNKKNSDSYSNSKAINKSNKLTLIDVCYNSIINNYLKDNCFSSNNNLEMYHYYDKNQRRIEKIIPNINEYLINNSNEKKLPRKKINKFKKYKNNNNYFQYTFNNSIHEHKKNKKIQIKFYEEKKNDINLFLYNSINNGIKMINNKANNKQDFSCKVPHKKRKNHLDFEKITLNYDNKDKKLRIGMFNYLSQDNRKIF